MIKWLRRFEEDVINQNVTLGDGQQLQLGLREVRLYELTFPKQAVKEVVGLLGDQPMGKWNKYKTTLRKALRLKPVPKPHPKQAMLPHDHVGTHLIGIKEDRDNEDGTEHI